MTPISSPVLPLAEPHAKLEIAEPVHDAGSASAFGEVLEGAVASSNDRLKIANAASAEFASGARDDIHGTMIALANADITLRLAGNVRNKVVDAFYELWRMQI